jgi:secretion/DNA translocation related TadE-like protein
VIARHRARNAADAGALSGAMRVAQGAEVACAAAERLVRENRGRLTSCVVQGATVTVTAEVRAGVGVASQRARAGPVSAA